MRPAPTRRAARFGVTFAFCCLFALILAGCGGGSETTPNPPAAPPPVTGTVSGVVVAAGTGQPLANVAVSAGGRSTTTDVAGRYALANVPAANPAVVKFDLAGYIRGVSTVALPAAGNAIANPRLTAVATAQQFNAVNGAVVSVPNSSAQVRLPANGLVNQATGAAATGTVTAEVTPIDPATDPAAMPGNFQASGAAAPISIESFGALSVVLRDGAGSTLDLAGGQTATVRIPVATRSAAAPSSIPLFYFNETTGLWVEEGTATLQGVAPDQYYEGTVRHFTVWNADRPTETVFIGGCAVTETGQPAAGATVETNGINYSGTASVQTNAQGNFNVPMRRGTGVATLYGQLGGRFSNVVQVGPTDSNSQVPQCLRIGDNNAAPAIVQHPASQSVPLGICTVLRVEALGESPLRYQWQRNGADIAGASAATLMLCPVTAADDNASFGVVISNARGNVTSNAAVITVAPPAPPQIITQPSDQQVQIGAAATFGVEAIAFGGTLTYQWLRGGASIPGATGSTYTTPPTTAADNGASFSVVVTSSVGGSVTSNAASLTVSQAAAPSITQQPQDQSVNAGQSATFTVGATGTPAPTYQWFRSGQSIAGANGASYSTPPAQLADDGAIFTVTVSNSLGSVTSAGARLTVTQPSGGAGYYHLGGAGPLSTISITYANGAQDVPSQALMGVREDAPASGAVTVETAGATSVLTLGAFEAIIAADQMSRARPRFAVYVKGTRFFKVDQVAASSAPVPQALSSLASTDVCGNTGIPMMSLVDGNDWSDAARSWMFFRAPGADLTCGNADDVHRAVRLNMTDTAAAPTLGEPLAAIRTANGALSGVIVRNGNQVQSLNADLGGATDLFQVDAASFASAGTVFGSALPGLWIFVDGRTLYGVNLANPANRVVLATLATGEVLMNRLAADGSGVYLALNGATTARVLKVSNALVASDVTTLDAPATNLALTPTRVVAALDATPLRVVSALKAGGAMQPVHTAPSGEVLLLMLASGENVYLSKLGTGVGALGSNTAVVGADGTNAQTLANTRVLKGIGATVVSLSQGGLAQTYAVLIADGLAITGDFAGATVRLLEGATRNTLTTFGSFPPAPPGAVFPFGVAPLQYGLSGILNYFGFGSTEATDLYYFKSDVAGLMRVTSFVTE